MILKKKKTNNYKKVKFDKAIAAAYQVLEVHSIREFPVNLFEIFEEYDNLTVLSYGEIMEAKDLTRDEVARFNKSFEGAISYDPKDDQYLIAYNELIDKKRNKEKIFWTLAHEFGHFYLQHNKRKDQFQLFETDTVSEKYDIYEKEANFFARFLLNPPPLIVKTGMFDEQQIQDAFGVSNEVARITKSYIARSHQKGFRFDLPKELLDNFQHFIELNSSKPPISAATISENYEEQSYKGDGLEMEYSEVKINDFTGLPERCPKCSNESNHSVYCQICGTYQINVCTGLELGSWYEPKVKWHTLQAGCGNRLNGKARFCPTCGSTTTFLEEGLLPNWEDEQSSNEEANRMEAIHMLNTRVNFDDNLPF